MKNRQRQKDILFSILIFGSASYLEISVEDDPYMEVRGVRKS